MEMKYCMHCGHKLDDKYLMGEGMVPYCPECKEFRFPVYNTAVSMIVMNKELDKVLLIKQYGRDSYILVAGYVNKGEDAEDAVKREIGEEMGLQVLECHFNRSHYFAPSNTLMLNFTAIVEEGEPHPNSEIDAWKWFSVGEARANIRDIETKGDQAFIYIWGKGHSEPDIRKPLAPEVKAALDDYLAARTDNPTGSSPLFTSTGNRSRGKRIAPTTISTILKKALQAAGYDSERITPHSLRHTAGTAVMQLSGDLYITQKYMRHSNPATTEIYLHNQTESQEAEIARMLYDLYHSEPEAPAAITQGRR